MAIYLGNTPIAENVTIQQGGDVTIDDTLSDTSKNPVQNKVINAALNSKANLSDIPTTLPADGGNADTLDGLHESSFAQNIGVWNKGDIKDLLLSCTKSGFVWIQPGVTGMPNDDTYWFGIADCHTVHRQLIVRDINNSVAYCMRWNNGTQTWISWRNLADGGNADTVDGLHAKEFMSGYTYVVDSDETLRALVENDEGNDYSYVLIKKGSWSYELTEEKNLLKTEEGKFNTSSGSETVTNTYTMPHLVGINLNNISSKKIIGEEGSEINISANGIDNARIYGIYTTNTSDITVQTQPVVIENITLNVNLTGTAQIIPYGHSCGVQAYGIYGGVIAKKTKITTITNKDTDSSNNIVTLHSISCSMYKCIQCIDCIAIARTGKAQGFANCKNLVGCVAIVSGHTNPATGIVAGFTECIDCVNCRANASNAGYDVVGFDRCYNILCCDARASGAQVSTENYIRAFYRCKNVTGCYSNNYAVIFENCENLTNCCVEKCAGGPYLIGYKNCKNLRGCISDLSKITMGSSLISFTGCTGMLFNEAVKSSSPKYISYSNCYSGHNTSDDTYLCADTANGGWNTVNT